MTAVDEAIKEIDAALEVNQVLLEGARHFAEMGDLQPATRAEIEDAVVDYDRRNGHLREVRTALTNLVNDGYPAVPQREVDQAIINDLRQDAETINAALAKYASNAALELGLRPGDAEPK